MKSFLLLINKKKKGKGRGEEGMGNREERKSSTLIILHIFKISSRDLKCSLIDCDALEVS